MALNISLITSNGSDDSFTGNKEGTDFFNTYNSTVRFVMEVVLAIAAVSCNLVALGLSRRHRYHHHAYRALFWNMSIANTLSAISAFLGNNSIKVLSLWPPRPEEICIWLRMFTALNFSAMVFPLVAASALLGFALVHYLLLCQPLHSDRLLYPNNVRRVLVLSWLFCTCLGTGLSMWITLGSDDAAGRCDKRKIPFILVIGTDIFVTLISLIYMAVIGFTTKLYFEIKGLRRNLGRIVFFDDLQTERRTLRTLILLLSVTAIFWCPYYIFYTLSLNTSWITVTDNSFIVYSMTMLPYLKYCSDPLIYGKRMLGLQQEITRIANRTKCMCKKNKDGSRHSSRNNGRSNTPNNMTKVYEFNKPLVKQ